MILIVLNGFLRTCRRAGAPAVIVSYVLSFFELREILRESARHKIIQCEINVKSFNLSFTSPR